VRLDRQAPDSVAGDADVSIDRRPKPLKMDFSLWSRAAVGQLIEQEFGIRLQVRTEPAPISWTPRTALSVIHRRPVRSLATNRKPAVRG
jgi:hypothetical protein